MFKKIHIRSYEVGLKFRDGEFVELLGAGTHVVLHHSAGPRYVSSASVIHGSLATRWK